MPPLSSPATTSPVLRPRPGVAMLLRRSLWRGRFVVAACCCGLVATLVVGAVRPDPLPTVAVVVTARAVPAGHRLASGDVRLAHVPAALAPTVSLRTTRSVRGRTTSTSLPAGTVLVPSLVAAGDLGSGAPPGTVVVAVTLDAAGAAVVSPGAHVDLLTAGPKGATYLARDALVLVAPGGGSTSGGGGGGSSGTVAVATTPAAAESLAALPDGARVTAALVP